MNKLFMFISITLLFGVSGCGKQQPIDSTKEHSKVLDAEKRFIKAIVEKDKASFIKSYADNHISQTNAIYHYDFFVLYRELYLIITNKFGEEGWEHYKSFESGGGFHSCSMAEIALENIDDYVERLEIEFQGKKAAIQGPEGLPIVRRKIDNSWVLDIKDNPTLEWDEELAKISNNAYHVAIQEANLPSATVESIKKASEDFIDNQMP